MTAVAQVKDDDALNVAIGNEEKESDEMGI